MEEEEEEACGCVGEAREWVGRGLFNLTTAHYDNTTRASPPTPAGGTPLKHKQEEREA